MRSQNPPRLEEVCGTAFSIIWESEKQEFDVIQVVLCVVWVTLKLSTATQNLENATDCSVQLKGYVSSPQN